MTRNRKVSVALGALAVLALPFMSYVLPAMAAGFWANWPLVGSASFCSSTNTAGVPGTSSVCTTTTPAGPTVVTGLETLPADANVASGGGINNLRLSLASLNALPLTSTTVLATQATIGFAPSVLNGGLIIISAAAISPTTVTLPPSAIDGQQFRLSATQNIPVLTISGSGSDTVSNAPTALTVSTTGGPYGYTFRYRKSDTKWYRLQ